jgi:hypothetical protein
VIRGMTVVKAKSGVAGSAICANIIAGAYALSGFTPKKCRTCETANRVVEQVQYNPATQS